MRALITIAFALSGCIPALVRGAERPPRPAHAAILDLVAETWRGLGLPWSSTCDAERDRIVVAIVDNDGMRWARGYCAAEAPICVETRGTGTPIEVATARARGGCAYGICTAGSVLLEHSEPWPIGLGAPWRVTLLVSGYQSPEVQRAALIHEYAHALSRCALGSLDEAHAEPRVWSRAGVVRVATELVQ